MESGNDHVDKFVCPNDRQLALRGRLDIGWSTFAENVYKRSYVAPISDEEQVRIANILLQAKEVEEKEQERIGLLVDKVNSLKDNKRGDGETSCLVCGIKKGSLKPCIVCSQGVCPKCVKESADASGLKRVFCIICWEERELWKKSGAWFLKSMPVFITPEERLARMRAEGYDVPEGYDPVNLLNPRASVTTSIRRPSFFTEDDEITDESGEETDDDISSYFEVSSDACQGKTNGFNLGIDVSEVSKEIPRSVTPPEISLIPETPDSQPHPSFANAFDQADGFGSNDSLSPRIRPRSTSNMSENKKKLAMKFRKKGKDAHSQNPKDESESGQGKDDQDIDQIFKSYEQENGLEESEEKPESFGPLGMLEFTLQYDSKTLELLVIVHCGKGLKAMDHGKSSDPYVKAHLLPGALKSTKKRTQTVLKNLNPVFNETLIYHGISQKDISQKILRLSVMDENKLSSNAFIGETCVPLKSLINRPVQRFRRLLDEQSDDISYEEIVDVDDIPGRIELALHYLSKQQKLVVGIIRCAGLKAMDPNGYSDPYVKCYLLPDPKKKSKKKTAIKKKTLNPEFNEEFTYEISHDELVKKTLCITVWDYDVGTKNDFIGSLTLGINARGEALKHWFETMKKSDRRVTRWHTLSFFMPSELEEVD
ncbi:rabphilin-3A-like isoform X2 [Rhopilema esculentum]|uniref:rabphilin-3A-like isoform X2 n=1 Tax=Rhopilema esculentum TaxID=499914 RepID=UPI0031D4B394